MRRLEKEVVYQCFILWIIYSVYQYGIHKICGFTMYPDEFGYWASAAKAVGIDWSAVASLGSYYSFGYSLILIPALLLFRSGIDAYRAAITVNMLLLCASFFLLNAILKKIFQEADGMKRIWMSGIAIFYPPCFFYMQMTMAEALLFFMLVLNVYIFICLMLNQRKTTAIMLAVSLIYMYSVHMRTVGVLAACLITFVLWMIIERPQLGTVIIFWMTLILSAILVAVIKRYIVINVFSDVTIEVLTRNDYGSQWNKLQKILTVSGMAQFFKEIAGKVFYLGLAGFGLFYWGMGWSIKETFLLVKKLKAGDKAEMRQWMALFLLLAAIGEILIGNIYMYPSSTIDALVYGRYDEFIMPVFMLIGVFTMCRSRWIFVKTTLFGVFTGLLIPMLLHVVEERGLEGLRGYMVVGISCLLKEENLNVSLFFRDTWLLGFCIMLLAAFFIWLAGRSRNVIWFLAGIMVIEIIAGIQASWHYTYRVNNSNFMDLCIAEKIKERTDEKGRVVYLDEGEAQYIDFIQMQLRERKIEVISEEKYKDTGAEGCDFLITHIDTEYKNELDVEFQKCIKSNDFYLFYDRKEGT